VESETFQGQAKKVVGLARLNECHHNVGLRAGGEGDGRFHYQDNAKFCRNARGSCKEVLDHLIAANDESLISAELLLQSRMLMERSVKLLSAYIRYLSNAKRSE